MTPATQSAKGVDYQRVNGKNVLILDGQAKALMEQWPTPRATDGAKGGPNQAGSKGDLMLPSATAQWPTPASRDYRTPNSQSLQERGQGSKGEQLPNFVEHHFSRPALSTLDGLELFNPRHGSPLPLPIHLEMAASDDSTRGLPSGSWDGQSAGRRI